jgi:hypothetical protein
MRFLRNLLLLLIATTFAQQAVQAGGLRVALLASAEVQSDTILLANLLPQNVERSLRSQAEKVPLGAAPQSGAIRVLSREAVNDAIVHADLPQERFVIPESIRVHRSERLLSAEEVHAAVQSALSSSPIARLGVLQPEDLAFDSTIRIPQGQVSLLVTQIVYDEFIGRVRFRVQPKTVPAILPFYVTARVPFSSAEVSAVNRVLLASAGNLSGTRLAQSPVLVEPGHMARLRLHSQNFDGVFQVRPLERGRMGDTICVRLPSSGKTLRARVVSAGNLDATF